MNPRVMSAVAVVIGCFAGLWLARLIPPGMLLRVILAGGACLALLRILLLIMPKVHRE